MPKRRKGFTTMKNVAATTTEQTATVAEQGAPVAPEKAASKKGATQKKDAPKGQKTAKGGKAQAAAPKKESKASKKAAKPATAKEVGLPKGASIPNQEIATEIVPDNEPPPARVGGFLRLRLFEGLRQSTSSTPGTSSHGTPRARLQSNVCCSLSSRLIRWRSPTWKKIRIGNQLPWKTWSNWTQ
jgi:hypothetical protein